MDIRYPNPFTPRFGMVPRYLAGREHLLSQVAIALTETPNDPILTSLFCGPRGTGKTALLHALADIARGCGWICASVSAVPGMLEDIYQQSLSDGAHLVDVDSLKVTSASVGPIGASWKEERPYEPNWRTRMDAILDQLASKETGLLILVDEVKASDEMVQLVSIYQHFVGEGRKVALFMAGLPHDASILLSHDDVSFLRRASYHHLGNVTVTEAAVAMRRTIEDFQRSIDEDALAFAAEASNGYPYLMQLIGFRMWAIDPSKERITLKDAEDGVLLAFDEFEHGVLQASYRELSAGDLAFLEAMTVDEGMSSLRDIASRMGVSSGYASKYRKRLMEKGILAEPRKGYVELELPGLKEYAAKQMLS